jgi:transketolase
MSVGIELLKLKKLNNDDHLVYTLHGDGRVARRSKLGRIMYASKK